MIGLLCLFMFGVGCLYMAINQETKIEQAFFIEATIVMNIAFVLLLIENK